ncbi:MAG: leucine-rich repeat domain-containing protein [Eubacteriales bacterium]|jgi:Leucine-rich repeat (LRR) protein
MKSVLKITLIFAILSGICIGVYWSVQPQQRSTVCLWLAQTATDSGNDSFASKMYETALKVHPENKLARYSAIDYYRASGNITKLEYHLLCGIETEPGNSFYYEELCRTYVEQGKFYDAVQLLDNIEDAVVYRKISSSRPKTPVISPESGTYRGTFSITIDSPDNARIYCSTNGDFPTEYDISNGDISPTPGEMKLMAVCIDNNGLISPVATSNFMYLPEVASVTFEDEGVERIVRSILLRPEGDISSGDLRSIVSFSNALENEIVPIDTVNDLKWCTGLEVLELTGVENALDCIESLTQLQTLSLIGCSISDPSPISGLQNLVTLDLSNNIITSVASLKDLPMLERLHIRSNALVDISSIGEFSTLRYLDASDNAISDISPLRNCKSLEMLALDSNKIEDISDFGSLTDLKTLYLSNNLVFDIDPLKNCVSLTTLSLSNNKIEILDPLSKCTNLISLSAAKNNITIIEPLGNLHDLSIIDLSENTIINADSLATCTSLVQVNLSKNFLTDISLLSALPNLQELNIENNNIKNLSEFASAPSLTTIYAFGNPVKDTSALEDAAITVYK